MAREYYITADGGGTKLISILYDNEFNLIAVGRSGSVNPNFETNENVREHMRDCIAQCLEGRNISSVKIGSCAMAGPYDVYQEELSKQVKVGEFIRYQEGGIPLFSGVQKRVGMVAISGTGSDVFYRHADGELSFLGGLGSLLGDDGSGYTIGREGIRAALFQLDGYGKKTLLTQLAKEHFDPPGEHPMAIVGKIYKHPTPRGYIASFCKKVSIAAHQGDKVALSILSDAGNVMADQAMSLIKRDKVPTDTDVVISGGAWKAHPIMFERFRVELMSRYPNLAVSKPLFEPVMGAVLDMALGKDDNVGDELMEKLKIRFAEFLYKE